MERRVVITGIGLVTPLGLTTAANWDAALAGRSGIGPITRFDASGFGTRFAGEVKDFNPADFIEKKEIKKMDRFIQFAIAAATEAVADSGLTIDETNAERVGVIVGSGMGGLETLGNNEQVCSEKGPDRVSAFFIPGCVINLAPGQISIRFGAKGPNFSPVSACATGTHAIGEAFHIIKRGEADAIISGGAEATITPVAVAGFSNMKALSSRNDAPEKASRPFDAERDGFVMGEGAGILILEELEHARKRGAKIYAEVVGFGMNSDAYHITSPIPDGSGAARCMELAVASAGIAKEEVSYINAHGTSTPINDAMETQAIKQAFGDHARQLLVSSTKSMTGHLLGAAGGVETAFSALALYHQMVPPTINLEHPDPDCDLDYVAGQARSAELKVAISNSFGFGSTNACVALRRFTE
ncbi:3-oxoacyl-[acyl-carrier-protein] synthase II [Hydrogenispora ethanolica]|uniref:3-oxoacyl-[acyl-carrier-protein] synthase 2 n=1 Tax=Hydrogenispora ethanolica TaxID=1082276 RepID=A0A4R1RU79_HYDET|nr:beta-ketoacyl-ACP synthase II [Hydrogenispora ethanolica]TCL70121.1 3-oxoacyl-[acyl-carrier-protein] synthase II [Hydrogenispora ethanolica]